MMKDGQRTMDDEQWMLNYQDDNDDDDDNEVIDPLSLTRTP